MTISAARLNANRRNASRSKGPVTETGKQRVRLNAWKHGLRAESDAVAPEEAEAVAARRQEWASAFPAEGGHQRWLVDQVVLASVRIDRCQARQRTQASSEADRAATCWEVDREADAARLGARLAKDPDRVVAELCRSLAGLDWLLDRWRGLADRLGDEGPWDDAHRRLCLDLMQVPEPFREAELARLARIPLIELRVLVRETIAGLESLRETVSGLDEADRALAELGLPTSEGPEPRRLRRYESALWRRYRSLEASWKAARAGGPDDPIDDEDDSRPVAAPIAPPRTAAPRPIPPPGPPGPRPDRSASRTSPDPAPAPAETATIAPRLAPSVVRLVPAAHTAPRNRRERRALEKAKSRR